MDKLLKRLPGRQSILNVYATAVFVIYGWIILTSFWKLPSWMFFLSLGEILSIYAYSFVVAFTESLLVLFALLSIGFFFPPRWWNDRFTSTGMIWILVVEGSVMLRLYTNRAPTLWEQFLDTQGLWWMYTFIIAFVLTLLVAKIGWMRKGFELFAERLIVFLYIYIPVTVISFFVVFLRNVL